jgi:hypothetical protein
MQYVYAHARLANEVDAEQERLECTWPDTAPLGGWRNTAIETVAARERMNPYALAEQIKPYS